MNCPKCSSERITPCDRTAAGTQRYQCMDCKAKFVPGSKGRGRKPLGDRAMSNGERQQKHRNKKKQDSVNSIDIITE